MRPRLTDEKKEDIKKMLIQGYKINDIAEQLDISRQTVLNYKKEFGGLISSSNVLLKDTQAKEDYRNRMTSTEKFYSDMIAKGKEIYNYDDSLEGWTFHLLKGDHRLKQSGMEWNVIVYPESAPENWIELLRERQFRFAVSPLHDMDEWKHDNPEYINQDTGEKIEKGSLYKRGDKKKAHWHVIILLDQRTAYTDINAELQQLLHCPYIQKCRSVFDSYNYFLHMNAPDKYQGYSKDDIQEFNGFRVVPNKYECSILMSEMVDIIEQHHIEDWKDCVTFFRSSPVYNLVLSTHTAYFANYVKSSYLKNHPVRINYTEFKQVDEFSCLNDGEIL